MDFRFLTLSLACLLLGSCSVPRAYEGERIDKSELVTIRGYSSICSGALKIIQLDGKYSGYRFQAKPGPHQMTILYRGEPFLPEVGDSGGPYGICTLNSAFKVSFVTVANRTYFFDIHENRELGHILTVSESNDPRVIDAHPIPAQVERTSFARQCTLASYYRDCFTW